MAKIIGTVGTGGVRMTTPAPPRKLSHPANASVRVPKRDDTGMLDDGTDDDNTDDTTEDNATRQITGAEDIS
jgi:hypothetical protein